MQLNCVYFNMYDWTNFDTIFGKASKGMYEQNVVHTISSNRQNMEGVLFFDRIWESLGLKHGEMTVYGVFLMALTNCSFEILPAKVESRPAQIVRHSRERFGSRPSKTSRDLLHPQGLQAYSRPWRDICSIGIPSSKIQSPR